MALSTTTIQALAPSLYAAAGEDKCLVYLRVAEACHGVSIWGGLYDTAMAYYALHLLSLTSSAEAAFSTDDTTTSATSGPITSIKSGQLSETYANNTNIFTGAITKISAADMLLTTTPYGQQYLLLRATLGSVGTRLL